MKRVRQILALALCTVLCLSTTGCLRQLDGKKLAVVEMVGIDRVDDLYLLSAQVFDPSSGSDEGSGGQYELFTAEGRSISHAAEELGRKAGGSVFWGGNKLIVVGALAARAGISDVVHYFNAQTESRPQTPVIVSRQDAAAVVAGVMAERAAMQIEEAQRSGAAVPSTVMTILDSLLNENENPTAALGELSGQAAGAEDNQKPEISLVGTAVFVGDRLAGEANLTATRGILWALGKVEESIVAVDDPAVGRVSLAVTANDSKIHCEIRDGVPEFSISLAVSAAVVDIGGRNDFAEEGDYQRISDAVERVVEQETLFMLRQSAGKNTAADLIGLTRTLRKERPGFFHERIEAGDNPIAGARYAVDAAVELKRLGIELGNV